MRSKDELDEDDVEAFDSELGDGELILDNPVAGAGKEPETPPSALPKIEKNKPKPSARTKVRVARPAEVAAPDFASMSPVEAVRKRIEMEIGNRSGVTDVSVDSTWETLIQQASDIGDAFDFGRLNVLYLNKGSAEHFIVVPGKEVAVVSISAEAPADRIISIFT
jgi:hypothetical protein